MPESHTCPPPDSAESTLTAARSAAPPTDRREAVRSLGAAGLAMLAALGLATSTNAAKQHVNGERQRRRAARRQTPATRQQRRRTENQVSPTDEGSDHADKLLLFGGGFLGLTKVSATKEIAGKAFDAVTAQCPPPAFGEQIVAMSGGYAGQILNDRGFQLGNNGPSQDNGWVVSALNTSDSKLTLSVTVLCARFQR